MFLLSMSYCQVGSTTATELYLKYNDLPVDHTRQLLFSIWDIIPISTQEVYISQHFFQKHSFAIARIHLGGIFDWVLEITALLQCFIYQSIVTCFKFTVLLLQTDLRLSLFSLWAHWYQFSRFHLLL